MNVEEWVIRAFERNDRLVCDKYEMPDHCEGCRWLAMERYGPRDAWTRTICALSGKKRHPRQMACGRKEGSGWTRGKP